MYFTFYIPALPAVPPAFLARLGELPGIYLVEQSKLLKAPENVAWLVEKALQDHGLTYTARQKDPLRAAPTTLPVPPEVKDFVPGFLAPYQKDAILKMGHRPAVRVYHAPGSGKSLTAIYLSLLHPGPTLFVTRAAARETIAEEVAKFTHCQALILSGSPSLGIPPALRVSLDLLEAEGKPVEFQLPSDSQLLTASPRTIHGIAEWATAASLAKNPRPFLWRIDSGGLHWRVLVPLDRVKSEAGPAWNFALAPAGASHGGSGKGSPAPLPRFLITAWETLQAWTPLACGCYPHVVVWDESHLGANPRRWGARVVKDDETGDTTSGLTVQFSRLTNRAAAAEAICKVAKVRIETTASPIRDRLRNLWAQLDLTEPGAWGKFNPYRATLAQQSGPYAAFYCGRKSWAERYCDAHSGTFGGIDSRGRAAPAIIEELRLRMSYATHVVPYSVTHAQLPSRRVQVTYLGPDSLARPESIDGTGPRAKLEFGNVFASSMIEGKLAQACGQKRPWVLAKAIEALEGGSKVVILTARRKDCDELGKGLIKAFTEKNTTTCSIPIWVAHGGCTVEGRDEIRRAYMAEKGAACIVATGDSFGESLNLQDTDLAIFAMLPYTPGQLRQWMGRFVRKGMTRPVLLLFPIAEGTVDEHVAGLLLDKLPAIDQIVGDEELKGLDKTLSGIGSDEEAIAGLMKMLNLGDS